MNLIRVVFLILNTGATKAPRLGKLFFFPTVFSNTFLVIPNKTWLEMPQFIYSGEQGGVIEGSGSSIGGGPGEGKSSKFRYSYIVSFKSSLCFLVVFKVWLFIWSCVGGGLIYYYFFLIKGVTGGSIDGDGLDGVTGTGIPILAGGKPGMTLNADV